MFYKNKKNLLSPILVLILVLSFISLFLTSWIILSAPTFFLLKFGVVAPEICPWLFVLNLITLILSLLFINQRQLKRSLCIFSLIGLLICSWELASIIPTQIQMNAAMVRALGARLSTKNSS